MSFAGASMLMGVSYPVLTASASPGTVSGSDSSSTVTTNAATITASGGSGSRTFAWLYVSGSAAINAVSPNSATSTFQATGMSVGSITAQFRGRVTDTITGIVTYTSNITVYLERGYPALSLPAVSDAVQYSTSSSTITVTASTSASPSGGVPPYSYSWSGGGDYSVSPSAGSCSFSKALGPGGGVSGPGSVTVTDSIGQTATSNFGVLLVNNGTAPPAFSISASPSGVFGISPSTPVQTGSTTVTPTGNVGSVSYSWSRTSGVGAADSSGSPSTTFSANIGIETAYGGFQCAATDSLGRVAYATVSAEFTRYNFG